MNRFTIRMELHDSDAYDVLHREMETRGFLRTITSDDGSTFHLPFGEYNFVGTATRQFVLDRACEAADAASKLYSVLVTEGVRAFRYLEKLK